MDLKLFSQDSFHLKDWVNNVFNHSEAKDCNDVKQYTSSLVMRLQLAIQEVNNNIEEESSQIVTTLPRVLRDVEALSHEASILKSQMTNVKKEIEEVERNTAASMQTLVELDAVKGRLSASSQALKEADNWTTLSSDIEEVMDSCDIEAISEKLVALQSCLSILAHVPDYEDRVAHLEGLKVRLEALLSPHLVAAFGKHDLEDSTKYAKILSALGRSRNLESYYHKCETQQLLVAWRSGVEGHTMSGQPTWLTNFYEQLSSLITKQMKWCEQVFPDSDPVLLLAELCCSVLSTLDPSASQVVSVALKQQEEPLAFLAALKKAAEDFLGDYHKLVAASSKPALNAVNRNVAEAIFGPLKEQVAHYQDFEESLLLSHLISADVVQGDISESLQLLKNYCSKLLPQTELASERCLQLTSGFAFPALIKAIGTYLENIMERLAQVARHVEQQTTSIQDDWTVFNTCLSLIQTSGEFLMSVDSMEHSLTTTLATIASRAKEDLSRPPLAFQPTSVLGQAQIDAFNAMVDSSVENDQRLLERGLTQAQCQCEKSVEVALSTIMAPISCQLVPVANLPAWNSHSGSSSSLSASFSPQEYITQIGQYLLTLPQHLEPLLVNHSPSLNRALQETDLRSGSENRVVSESEVSAADFLISSVSQSTCRLYTDIILRIPEISPNMITQLTTDIDYICNIFEDLGVSSCDPLDKLNLLLKAPAEDYWSVVPGNNPRLVAAVRQIRDIPAKS